MDVLHTPASIQNTQPGTPQGLTDTPERTALPSHTGSPNRLGRARLHTGAPSKSGRARLYTKNRVVELRSTWTGEGARPHTLLLVRHSREPTADSQEPLADDQGPMTKDRSYAITS